MKQDSAWKDVLEALFPDFIAYFFPKIFVDINWQKPHVFLDKELQQIIKSANTGKKVVDKLVKVFLEDGTEKWLLIHVEIQGVSEIGFSKRMYVYNYRLADKFDKEVISLIVLSDSSPSFRENIYQIKRWDFECTYRFPMVKLLDFKGKEDSLQKSTNPFAKCVLAFLRTLETKGKKKQDQRYYWKRLYLLELYDAGFTKKQILGIYKFIDWIMTLPKDLDERIFVEVNKAEKGKSMPYISTAERIGIEKGLEKGLEEGLSKGLFKGLQQSILDVLEVRFAKEGLSLYKKVEGITELERLQEIREQVKTLPSITDVESFFNTLN